MRSSGSRYSRRPDVVAAGWLAAAVMLFATAAPTGAAESSELEIFSRDGCARCTEAARFVAELQREAPGLRVVVRDVGRDAEARERLAALSKRQGIGRLLVPAFRVGGELLVGFRGGVNDRELRVRLGLTPP